jgi:hypothetical protein
MISNKKGEVKVTHDAHDPRRNAVKQSTPGVKTPIHQPASSEHGASTNVEIDRHPVKTVSSGQKKKFTRTTEETHPTRGDVVRK